MSMMLLRYINSFVELSSKSKFINLSSKCVVMPFWFVCNTCDPKMFLVTPLSKFCFWSFPKIGCCKQNDHIISSNSSSSVLVQNFVSNVCFEIVVRIFVLTFSFEIMFRTTVPTCCSESVSRFCWTYLPIFCFEQTYFLRIWLRRRIQHAFLGVWLYRIWIFI